MHKVLTLVERAFPPVPRPAATALPAHTDGCAKCEIIARELLSYPDAGLPGEAIRRLCDEMSALSAEATAWVLPSYLRYVLTEENPLDPRPTEFLIYNLAPAPEHAAESRGRLSLLTRGQVEALQAVVRHLADTPYWSDYCCDDLSRALAFLRELAGDLPEAPDAEPVAAADGGRDLVP